MLIYHPDPDQHSEPTWHSINHTCLYEWINGKAENWVSKHETCIQMHASNQTGRIASGKKGHVEIGWNEKH